MNRSYLFAQCRNIRRSKKAPIELTSTSTDAINPELRGLKREC
jgi:hypothetical protein